MEQMMRLQMYELRSQRCDRVIPCLLEQSAACRVAERSSFDRVAAAAELVAAQEDARGDTRVAVHRCCNHACNASAFSLHSFLPSFEVSCEANGDCPLLLASVRPGALQAVFS